MPYQTLPGLIVCGAAFAFVGAGMQVTQWLFLDKPKRRMNHEYVFQMDLRDDLLQNAKKSLEKDNHIPNVGIYESRKDDYSTFQNTFNTYRIPQTNKYSELIEAANSHKQA